VLNDHDFVHMQHDLPCMSMTDMLLVIAAAACVLVQHSALIKQGHMPKD